MNSLSHVALILLLGTFAALGLSACAEGGSGQGADTTAMGADTTMSGRPGDMQQGGMQSGPVSVQNTISLLRGGVKSIAVNQAVQNINGWQQKLQKQSANQMLSQINDTLGQLKNDLQASDLDGAKVGSLLSKLGEQTSEAAQNASGSQMQQLQQLGKLLTQAGNQLTGSGS